MKIRTVVARRRAAALHSNASFLALALLAAAGLHAIPREPNSTERSRSAPVATVYIENDVFSGTDQHYTNGLKFSWLSPDLVDWGLSGWRRNWVEFQVRSRLLRI